MEVSKPVKFEAVGLSAKCQAKAEEFVSSITSGKLREFVSEMKEEYELPNLIGIEERAVYCGYTHREASYTARCESRFAAMFEKNYENALDEATKDAKRAIEFAAYVKGVELAVQDCAAKAWSAAWEKSRDWGMPRDAAWDFANHALLMASLIAVGDLEFYGKDEHIKHAINLMDAWSKGFCVAADVNGKLFLYRIERPPLEPSAPLIARPVETYDRKFTDCAKLLMLLRMDPPSNIN